METLDAQLVLTLFSVSLFVFVQSACDRIPEEGTIVYDVDFPVGMKSLRVEEAGTKTAPLLPD